MSGTASGAFRPKPSDIEIVPVIDEECFEIDLETMFPTSNASLLRAGGAWLAPAHLDPEFRRVRLSMKSWLIRAGHTNILVDTCIGQHKERPRHPAWHRRTSDRLLRDLAMAGLAPEDIDMVLCTHLHADHVGWNTQLCNGRWIPTFPKANYCMSGKELDDMRAMAAASPTAVNHGALQDSILPVVEAGQSRFVVAGDELLPGIRVESLPGHSIDHLGLLVTRQGSDALFCGDAIHSALQLLFPEWSSAFCADPKASAATRIAMLGRVADSGIELFPAHFGGPGSLRIQRHGAAFCPA